MPPLLYRHVLTSRAGHTDGTQWLVALPHQGLSDCLSSLRAELRPGLLLLLLRLLLRCASVLLLRGWYLSSVRVCHGLAISAVGRLGNGLEKGLGKGLGKRLLLLIMFLCWDLRLGLHLTRNLSLTLCMRDQRFCSSGVNFAVQAAAISRDA